MQEILHELFVLPIIRRLEAMNEAGQRSWRFPSTYLSTALELTPSLEEQLVRIYSPLARDESLVINIVSVQQQSGGTDCGLFPTAFALHTAMRKHFKTICFEQSLMRQHLLECLQIEALTEFPQSTSPSESPEEVKFHTL